VVVVVAFIVLLRVVLACAGFFSPSVCLIVADTQLILFFVGVLFSDGPMATTMSANGGHTK
jgi:hypothetical protein